MMFGILFMCAHLTGVIEAETKLMLLANRKDIRAVDLERNITRVVVDKTTEAVALSYIYSTGKQS